MDTEVFILRIFKSKIHPRITVSPIWHLYHLRVFILMGVLIPHTLGFLTIFKKNRNGILASQGNFKTVCISCGDEVRDYVFEKNFEKMLYKTFSKFGYIEGSFLSFFSNSIYSFLNKSQNAIFQQMGRS